MLAEDFKAKEEKLEKLKLANEVAQEEMTLAQRKATIAEAKKKYGRDWKKVLGIVGSLKINSEALQNLHALGIGNSDLRDMNNPAKFNQH